MWLCEAHNLYKQTELQETARMSLTIWSDADFQVHSRLGF